MKKQFAIVLVGRTNVGKSTLFNRLSEREKSLVLDYAGLTRDPIYGTLVVDGMQADLIDTAGIEGASPEQSIAQAAQDKTYACAQEADVIVLVLDGSVGVLPIERTFARWLHELKKPVIVAINKSDRSAFTEHQYEAVSLGFADTCAISSEHGVGIPELLDHIAGYMRAARGVRVAEAAPDTRRCAITLLGKPNVGKSSLLNALVGHERSLVSAQAGTTREAVRESVAYYAQTFELADTPGVRKKAQVKGPVEPYMVQATFQAVREADIIAVVVDATEGTLSDQVLKLAFYVFQEKYKALMIIITKWDLVTPAQAEQLEESLQDYAHLTTKVPVYRVSGLTGKNVGKLVPAFKTLCDRYHTQVDGKKLFTAFQVQLAHRPLTRNEIRLTIDRVDVVGSAPITLRVTVPEPALWEPAHIAFLEKTVRSEYDVLGVPIKFILVKQG